MAMTNLNQNPAPVNTLSPQAKDVLAAADKLKAEAKAQEDKLRAEANAKQGSPLDVAQAIAAVDVAENEADLLSSASAQHKDEVLAEEIAAAQLAAARVKQVITGEKSISDLCEDDAYNLEVAISAKAMYSPTALKVVMKDPNYIARWCNINPIRLTQLIGQGFRYLKPEMVANIESLKMFMDAQGNFMWADLTAMFIRKDIYYAGLRRAYTKSLDATNNRRASQAGAAFAASRLQAELSGSERSYMAEHQEAGSKPIYNPNLGV